MGPDLAQERLNERHHHLEEAVPEGPLESMAAGGACAVARSLMLVVCREGSCSWDYPILTLIPNAGERGGNQGPRRKAAEEEGVRLSREMRHHDTRMRGETGASETYDPSSTA